MTEPTDPMTPDEVAVLFGVGKTTASKWARRGLLPSFKTLGGHYRFDRAVVMEALQSGTHHRYRHEPRADS